MSEQVEREMIKRERSEREMVRAPALPARPRVSLVAPAGPLAAGAVDRALARFERWGWTPLLGAHARDRHGFLSAPDADRAADFNEALHDTTNDAIWCLRGGYGTMRILDRIDWRALRERPRPIIGFSDNTALHLAARREGVISFHGPHPAAELPSFAHQGLERALRGGALPHTLPFPAGGTGRAETITPGVAEGRLVGGNLSLISSTLGTPYAIDASRSILVLEEVGEPAYAIDRLLSHLQLAGVLRDLAGIAIGAFTECPDGGSGGLPTPEEILRERLGNLGIPVAIGFPVGHIDDNWTLPLGCRARLDADAGTLTLLEDGVIG